MEHSVELLLDWAEVERGFNGGVPKVEAVDEVLDQNVSMLLLVGRREISTYNAQNHAKRLAKRVGCPASLGANLRKAKGAHNDALAENHERQDHEAFV